MPPTRLSSEHVFPSLITLLLLFSPLTTSLPFPLPDAANNPALGPSPGGIKLQPRSPISGPGPDPDPRMIPDKTDLVSQILAGLGMDELNKFNKLRPEEHDAEDGAAIDDSHSVNHTVTSHDNQIGSGGPVKIEQHAGSDSQSDTGAGAGARTGAAQDPGGFVETLFEVLRKKFREAINGSDEIMLR
ncbi:hypothetical protein BJX99DRAFT_254844 [Aspergillus californicus]